jgi:hypothetical protein
MVFSEMRDAHEDASRIKIDDDDGHRAAVLHFLFCLDQTTYHIRHSD